MPLDPATTTVADLLNPDDTSLLDELVGTNLDAVLAAALRSGVLHEIGARPNYRRSD